MKRLTVKKVCIYCGLSIEWVYPASHPKGHWRHVGTGELRCSTIATPELEALELELSPEFRARLENVILAAVVDKVLVERRSRLGRADG